VVLHPFPDEQLSKEQATFWNPVNGVAERATTACLQISCHRTISSRVFQRDLERVRRSKPFFCLAWLNTMPCALSSSPLHRGCCGDVGRFTSGGLTSSAARTEALQLCLNGETVSRRCRPDVPSALRLLHASPPSAFAHIFSRLLHRFARFLSASFRVTTGYKRPPPLDIATTAARNLPSAFTKTCRVAL
jgi:hypothetical protein